MKNTVHRPRFLALPAAALATAGMLYLAAPAQALQLDAIVGGHSNFFGDCFGDPSPPIVGGTRSNSASCDGSSSTAFASSSLVLGASSSSTYTWQSSGSAGYRETFHFNALGLTGQQGALLINFAIDGSTSLSNDDEPLDAVAEFGAHNQDSTDSTGLFPLQFFGPGTVPFLLHFIYGQSVDLIVSLNAGTYGRNDGTLAISDFAHTVQVGSFEFMDANGNPVSDVSVTANGGVNPFVEAVATPEPATLALLGLGLAGLGLIRRRRAG